MQYQAILFDLDGTLLPMNEEKFVYSLVSGLVAHLTTDKTRYEQLAHALRAGLQHVIRNDGSCTNRQAFVRYFAQYTQSAGMDVQTEDIERFYAAHIETCLAHACGVDPSAAEAIAYIKREGTPIIVATNPFFPQVATYARIRWAGLEPSDFAEITTYENYHYCKPNLMYYRELFDRMGLDPHKCLMVGNNVDEDMIAQSLGCDVFLILRDLINVRQADISKYPQGTLTDLIDYLKNKQ